MRKVINFHIKLGKLALAVLALLIIAPAAWGANQVAAVDPDNAGKIMYKAGGEANCSDAKATFTQNTDLEAALTAAGASSTLYICAGTYTTTMIDTDDGLDTTANSQTITGAGRELTIIDITGVADGGITIGHTGSTVNDLTIKGTSGANYCYNPGNYAHTANRLTLGPGTRLYFSNAGSATSTLNRIYFTGATDTTWHAYAQGSSQILNINYSRFLGNAGDFGVQAGTANFNNCVWSYGTKRAVNCNTGTATININNAIIAGANSSTADIIRAAAGTINVNDSVYLFNWQAGTIAGSSTATTGAVNFDAGCVYKSPLFVSPRYPAIFVVGIDDRTNLAHWLTVADAAAARGIRTSYCLDLSATGILSAQNIADIQSRIAAGHEVLAHSKSHSDLTQTVAFTLAHATATATVTVDQSNADSSLWTATLALSTGENLDLTTYSLGTLETAINAIGGYTADVTAALDAYKNAIPAKVLAALAGGSALNPARDIAIAPAAWLQVELKDGKALLESELATTINSFVYPGNLNNATTNAAAKTYFPTGGAREGTSGDNGLSSIRPYKLYGYLASASAIGTTEDISAKIHGWVEFARATGKVFYLYDHTNAAFSVANWTSVFDALVEARANVMTMSEAIAYIRTNGATADSGVTYTRTLTDAANYALGSGSPAIDAGVAIESLHTGKTIVGGDAAGILYLFGAGVDIGAFERPKFIDGIPGKVWDATPKYYTVP